MSTMTAVSVQTITAMPRVNLLPPEIEQRRRLRRLQAGLGAGVVASVAVVGLLYGVAAHQASDAQTQLDTSVSQGQVLQAKVATYSQVPLVYAQVDDAKSKLTTAMGQEVRWSYYMNDLSLKVPARVWLTNLTVVQNVDGSAAANSAAAGPLPVANSIGAITFSGKAVSHDDVAAWLDVLGKQKGFSTPYLTSSKETVTDGTKLIEFSTTVTVTADAQSKRFTEKAGS